MAKKQIKKYIPEEELSADLQEMDRILKLIRAEYNQFFLGVAKKPPLFHEEQLRRLIKKFQGGDLIKKATDRFRFYNTVAKFNSEMEVIARKLKAREGGAVFGRQSFVAAPATPNSTPAEQHAHAEAQGKYRFSAVTRNILQEQATLKSLYGEYQRVHKLIGKDVSAVSVEKFQTYLAKQIDAVKAKQECGAVKFTLKVEDGKVKLTAKGVKS